MSAPSKSRTRAFRTWPQNEERLRRITGGTGRVLPQSSIRTALKTACRRQGLRSLSCHDFRRLFATRCIECGVDIPTAARWLGHQDGGALLGRVYFALMDPHSRAMAGRVVFCV